MAYDEYAAERVDRILQSKSVAYEQKKMFGGVAFMVNDKMCIGIIKNELMCRVGEDLQETALQQSGAKAMEFTGRPMRGYVSVEPDGFDTENQLEQWVDWCLAFNPKAKASKRKS